MNYYYKQNLMFPLSEEDDVQLGYIDTADYSEIESAMKADVKMPRIVMIWLPSNAGRIDANSSSAESRAMRSSRSS